MMENRVELSFLFLVFVLLFSTCRTVYYMSENQHITLKESSFDNAEIFFKKRKIPHSIKRAFKSVSDQKLRLANSGEKYLATDVRNNPFLPTRRLIFLVRTSDYYILFYEHGGGGKHYHCLLFRKDSNKKYEVMSIGINMNIKSYKELKESLIKGEYFIISENSCRY
ncbi:MAG: hypothetical protein KatS3mg035_2050 [Bacteroidia bacterium]|nr:MAG: hypothetical protein KatS3mg035_2050 [Bacteroidia bacterium]